MEDVREPSHRGCIFPRRYDVPLVADIHFQPQVAMMVAEAFEKVRINPGNFADGRKTFEVINYDDPAQFRAEQEHIREVSAHAKCSTALCLPAACCMPASARFCRLGMLPTPSQF
jgi:hypothetical protein